jgi:hypothetical protein
MHNIHYVWSKFVQAALKRVQFRVVVAEGEASTGYDGHSMAQRLVQEGCEVTVIPNANVYAIMSKVNKVQSSVLKDAHQELTFVPLKPRRSFSQRTL